MTINKQQEFDTFVKKFVTDNWSILSASKKYRQAYENDRDGCINYLPEPNQKPDPDYLGHSEIYSQFLNEFLDKFIFIDGLVFDLNGHFPDLTGRTFADVVASADDPKNRSFRYFSRSYLTSRFRKRLLMDVFTAFITVRDKEENKPIYYHLFAYDDNLLEIKDNSPCPTCDEYVAIMINYETNTISPHLETKPCKLPKSATRVSVSLKSPSGKLVFLNSPGEFFKEERPDQYEVSINSTLGCIEETKFHAKHNIGYFFIGNTVADIMQKKGEILTLCYNDEDDKQVAKYKDYTRKGDICTGLWWYTVLDYDLFIHLCEQHQVAPDSIKHTVVTTKALKYKVSHSLAAHTKGHYTGVYSKLTY
jgi:hypothetical protein